MPTDADYEGMARVCWDGYQAWKAGLSKEGTYTSLPWAYASSATRRNWIYAVQHNPDLTPRGINQAVRHAQLIKRVKALKLMPATERALLEIEVDIREGFEEEYASLQAIIAELNVEVAELSKRITALEPEEPVTPTWRGAPGFVMRALRVAAEKNAPVDVAKLTQDLLSIGYLSPHQEITAVDSDGTAAILDLIDNRPFSYVTFSFSVESPKEQK